MEEARNEAEELKQIVFAVGKQLRKGLYDEVVPWVRVSY